MVLRVVHPVLPLQSPELSTQSGSMVGLSPDTVADLFPFHIALDEGCHVVQAGETLRRLVPGIVGSHASTYFKVCSCTLLEMGRHANL